MTFEEARNMLAQHNITMIKGNNSQIKIIIDETVYWTELEGLDMLLHAVNRIHTQSFNAGCDYCKEKHDTY